MQWSRAPSELKNSPPFPGIVGEQGRQLSKSRAFKLQSWLLFSRARLLSQAACLTEARVQQDSVRLVLYNNSHLLRPGGDLHEQPSRRRRRRRHQLSRIRIVVVYFSKLFSRILRLCNKVLSKVDTITNRPVTSQSIKGSQAS